MLRIALCLALALSFLANQSTAADWRELPLVKNGQVALEWQHAGWGKMVVEGDAIRTEPEEKGLGLLVYTKEKFGDCQIRIVYRPQDARDNAGVHIRMDDGREFDCKPGDVSLLPSGHDAWTVGDEPAVVVDFQGMLDYARGQ